MLSTLTVIASLLVALQNAPDDPALRSAQKLAQKCAEATVKKDYAEVIDLTHPAAVAAMGGRTRAVKLTTEQMEKSEKEGVKMLSVGKVSLPEKVYPSKRARYCIVPVSFQIMIDGSKYYFKSSLIGISIDAGKTWKFVDISLGEKTVRKLLVDMPAELEFPPKAELIPESN